jgi:hypothetical protein
MAAHGSAASVCAPAHRALLAGGAAMAGLSRLSTMAVAAQTDTAQRSAGDGQLAAWRSRSCSRPS